MKNASQPYQLTPEQKKELCRLVAAHQMSKKNVSYEWDTLCAFIIASGATVATCYMLYEQGHCDMPVLGLFLIWAVIGVCIVEGYDALRLKMRSAKVLQLHCKKVSDRQITDIYNLGGDKVLEQLAKYDTRYIKGCVRHNVCDIPVGAACAIKEGAELAMKNDVSELDEWFMEFLRNRFDRTSKKAR